MRPSAARNRRPSNDRLIHLELFTDFFNEIGPTADMALQKTLLTRAVIPTASVDIDFGLANYAPPGWHLGPRMDIGAWLRSLGLERYEAAFRENEIDETVLPNLTAEDLKDLGVGIVGHRRKILDAIGALRVDESTKASIIHRSS